MSEKVALLMRKADSVATLHEFRLALSRRLKYARKRGERHDDNEQAEGNKHGGASAHCAIHPVPRSTGIVEKFGSFGNGAETFSFASR